MSKVHPAENKWQNVVLKERSLVAKQQELYRPDNDHCDQDPTVLTVWKRSSMSFQGTDGFTVFDQQGRLAFRVDNYSRNSSCGKRGLILMDGTGKALLTLKPQVFSLRSQWTAYQGEKWSPRTSSGAIKSNKVFTMRSNRSTVFKTDEKKPEAEVVLLESARRDREREIRDVDFRIEGWFRKRSCKVMNGAGEVVAEISRKRANEKVLLGDDVFSLVVKPGFDAKLVMAFVVVLDRICLRPYSPVLCS